MNSPSRKVAGSTLALLSLAASFAAFAPSASAQSLGAASDYNYFVFGNVNLSNTDVQGRAAIGGNATFSSYGVGSNLSTPAGYSLVVDGNLTYNNGQVSKGNVIVGGTSSGAFTVANGTLSYGDLIDFAAAKTSLDSLSDTLAATAANSAYTLNYGNLVFTGTNATLNTFTITAANFSSANSININAPSGSTVVINVSGSSVSLANLGINISGTDKNHVLYNFYDATSVNFSSISVQGSVLATDAAVTFNNGNFEGTLVSSGLSGNGEFHLYPFQGTLVPEPATFSLFGAAGVLLLFRRRK